MVTLVIRTIEVEIREQLFKVITAELEMHVAQNNKQLLFLSVHITVFE